MTEELNSLIQDYIADFIKKQNLQYVVKPSVPVVWFGDLDKYRQSEKRIVTVALNPSRNEFSSPRFNIVDVNSVDALEKLTETLNDYFRRNPYNWFRDFEKVLGTLKASYCEKRSENVAVHIDIYSAVATDPTWSKLSESQKMEIRRTDLFEKLLGILNPDVILFSANQTVFGEVFSQFRYEKGEENIGGKRGFFIRKYRNGDKIIYSGRNLRGQPFGGISDFEVQKAMERLA